MGVVLEPIRKVLESRESFEILYRASGLQEDARWGLLNTAARPTAAGFAILEVGASLFGRKTVSV